jgi:hypothetical protein
MRRFRASKPGSSRCRAIRHAPGETDRCNLSNLIGSKAENQLTLIEGVRTNCIAD